MLNFYLIQMLVVFLHIARDFSIWRMLTEYINIVTLFLYIIYLLYNIICMCVYTYVYIYAGLWIMTQFQCVEGEVVMPAPVIGNC